MTCINLAENHCPKICILRLAITTNLKILQLLSKLKFANLTRGINMKNWHLFSKGVVFKNWGLIFWYMFTQILIYSCQRIVKLLLKTLVHIFQMISRGPCTSEFNFAPCYFFTSDKQKRDAGAMSILYLHHGVWCAEFRDK
jgi:hypothetical protein